MTNAVFIDDDRNSLTLFHIICSHQQIGCHSIQNLVQFQQFLLENPPIDVIFVDLKMPFCDGYEMLQVLQAYEVFQQVPIVAITVHVDERDDARAAGFSGFITKPITTHDFIDKLHRIVAGEQIWETS